MHILRQKWSEWTTWTLIRRYSNRHMARLLRSVAIVQRYFCTVFLRCPGTSCQSRQDSMIWIHIICGRFPVPNPMSLSDILPRKWSKHTGRRYPLHITRAVCISGSLLLLKASESIGEPTRPDSWHPTCRTIQAQQAHLCHPRALIFLRLLTLSFTVGKLHARVHFCPDFVLKLHHLLKGVIISTGWVF